MSDAQDFSEKLVLLHSFTDALDAGRACKHLEAVEIPFLIKDYSVRQQGMHRFSEVPAIQMELLVSKNDLERAKVCLRSSMHMFPEPEIGIVEHGDDGEEVFVQAAACDKLEDAEAVRVVLSDANIWCTVTRIVDEEDKDYVAYSVDVKGKDIEKAIGIVERSWDAL